MKVLLVELHKRTPFSVIMSDNQRMTTLDVDYSRIDGWFYWHESGIGPMKKSIAVSPDTTYWLADDAEIKIVGGTRVKNSKYAKHPEEYRHSEVSETIWCGVCGDVRPTRYTTTVCDHIEWCDECGDYRTQNDDNQCPHTKATE